MLDLEIETNFRRFVSKEILEKKSSGNSFENILNTVNSISQKMSLLMSKIWANKRLMFGMGEPCVHLIKLKKLWNY
jgi:hypothetical protein